ncbi:MAG: Multi-sensor signal transduction histidine kinase [Candidatus Wolfebacteria bacterium GW2011_GWE1_48_7]|uniref:histidine kinase n=2 Tax=Candidatus Wolfeibacteriota TaxID=1752735 RepID=A0A0G1U4Y2_9BACT|nr:MAG: multi-sensor signal transduction histidine kinase [Candidatus Wolfebacteria bacterium GW2011_GWB1_47_1]KKU36147.1 MAG: Multi-sensor signal transduction histidine kinase [Candidatus Wolfebacteria bacterium GW2011_GWC2_46_275]KKU42169.1 MAG: Multi-sensor signal transduction histidine kinase [Candidatus Wolfebacteria bacterium GW2011_GWB2_46_69]KKU54055.1 MAG: Multi-sensor signal transduction histidine kinase [Candidatus Wolfebacteria bacterium GW2011_GWC1_47_103]KKU59242.1 MAG: Multi-sens
MEDSSGILRDIVGISEQLIGSREYKKTLGIIVDSLARLTGADRACIMLENMSGKFVIKAGYPIGEHGVNMVVTPEIGEEFLRAIIADGEILIIDDPEQDPRTSYMRDLAHNYGLAKVVFVPIVYHGESLGVLTLDLCQGKDESALELAHVRLLANLAAAAIGSEYERRRAKEKVRRMERMNAIGEESSRISHIFKNSLQMIGGFARRASRKIEERKNCFDRDVADALDTSIQEIARLERVVNGILRFSNPGVLHPEPVMINAFIKETITQAAGDMPVEFAFDEMLDVFTISIDVDLMAHAIKDVVINASQATGTGRLWVRTRFAAKRGSVIIEIANDGEKIEIGLVDDIFSPFVTTKSLGTGLGLANVKSIMAAHGGDVCLLRSTDEETVFEFSLLL